MTAVQSYIYPEVLPTAQPFTAKHFTAKRFNWSWVMVAGLIAMLVSVFAFTPAQARPLTKEAQRAIPSGNFHLEPGQVIDEDVVVFSGNVTLEEDSKITGDLLVMSGNIDIAENAVIEGDVAAFSGNITLYGTVEGDIAALSGNVQLLESAKVEGDISVASGNVDRDVNAEVEGEIVSGSGFDFGDLFGFAGSVDEEIRNEVEAEITEAVGTRSESQSGSGAGTSRRGGFGAVIGGIFGAIFTALVMGILAGVVALVRPSYIQSVQKRFRDELLLCIGTGLVVNVGVFLLSVLMAITIIGLLVAIPAMIALILLNILGGVTAAAALGERIIKKTNISASYPIKIGLGAAAIVLPIALLWSMGGCFSLIGFIGFGLLNSIGTGALVLPLVRRFMSDSPSEKYSGNVRTDDTASNDTGSNDTGSDDAGADDEDGMNETKPMNADSDADDSEVDSEEFEEDESIVEAVDEAAEKETTPKRKGKANAAGGSTPDDFTKIRGIGAVFAARLSDADITSFTQLAAMTAEEIGDIFGWPADRVERDNIIGQAQALMDE